MNLKKRLKLYLKFIKFLLPYKKKWIMVLVFAGISSILSVISPYLIKLAIDKGVNQRNIYFFIFMAFLCGVIFLCQRTTDSLKRIFQETIVNRINFSLNRMVFEKIFNLSLEWLKQHNSSENLFHFENDIPVVIDALVNLLPQLIYIIPKLILIVLIILYLNWQIGLFLLFFGGVFLFSYQFVQKLKPNYQDFIEHSEKTFQKLEELLSNFILVKAFAKEKDAKRRYLNMLIGNIRIKIKNLKKELFYNLFLETLTYAVLGLILLWAGFLIFKERLSWGSLGAILLYLYQLVNLQGQINGLFQNLTLADLSFQRVDEILESKFSESYEGEKIKINYPEIIFENVSFGYEPNRPVLENISFAIQPFTHIAITGPSGCGKTTLLLLLTKFYLPWQGKIFIEGVDIREWDLNFLREQIGFVLQSPFLWDDTIENNIRYGKNSATEEEVIKVSRICGIDKFIKELPYGYKTKIGKNAIKLSEGQKQRIAIARALIKNPKILILDEAMSSLDLESEREIIENIKSNYPLTLIVVSHRLSTILSADLVYYFYLRSKIIIEKPDRFFKDNQNVPWVFNEK